jgi:hypothetical protein
LASVFGVIRLGIGETRTIPRARISASRTVCIYSFQSCHEPRKHKQNTFDIRKSSLDILLPQFPEHRKHLLTNRQILLQLVTQNSGGSTSSSSRAEIPSTRSRISSSKQSPSSGTVSGRLTLTQCPRKDKRFPLELYDGLRLALREDAALKGGDGTFNDSIPRESLRSTSVLIRSPARVFLFLPPIKQACWWWDGVKLKGGVCCVSVRAGGACNLCK